MLSRVADAIYWMSRYVERAENVARFVDVTISLMLDAAPLDHDQSPWQALVSTTGDGDLFDERYGFANQDAVIRFLTTDTTYVNSIVSSVATARENARTVREVISREQWECLNQFYHFIQNSHIDTSDIRGLSDFYAQIRSRAALFQGLTDNTWSHEQGWQFARLGRLLERADKTSRILDVKYFILLPGMATVGTAVDLIQWSALLSSASAIQAYRQKHHITNPASIADFLIFDPLFPRSIRYCVAGASDSLHAIVGHPRDRSPSPAQQQLGRLRAHLDFGTIEEALAPGLHQYLDDLQGRLNACSSAVHSDFFAGP